MNCRAWKNVKVSKTTLNRNLHGFPIDVRKYVYIKCKNKMAQKSVSLSRNNQTLVCGTLRWPCTNFPSLLMKKIYPERIGVEMSSYSGHSLESRKGKEIYNFCLSTSTFKKILYYFQSLIGPRTICDLCQIDSVSLRVSV